MEDTMRDLKKQLFQNIPIFLFCVLFISGYNNLFGTANSIVGVVILTGLFILMRGDLGFDARQAAACLPILFLLVAVAPKLALLNPYTGLFINFAAISFIIILTGHDLSGGNHVPFLMGYLFCYGYDVSGREFSLRIVSLVIGSLIIALFYFFSNRKKAHEHQVWDFFRGLRIGNQRTQWYLKLSVTLSLTMFAGDLLHYPRTMWVALAVLSLTTPFGGEHIARTKARIPAAILGTALFVILFEFLIPEDYQSMFVLMAGFVAMFIKDYFVKSIYNSFSSLGAAVILFPVKDAVALRVVSNILGTVIALCSYALFEVLFRKIPVAEGVDNRDFSTENS